MHAHTCKHTLLRGRCRRVGLERWTGDQVVLGSNPAAATSLRNFGNSIYPILPVTFGGDTNKNTKSRLSLLSGVYAKGSKRSHRSALECVTCRGLHHNSKNNPACNTHVSQYRKERENNNILSVTIVSLCCNRREVSISHGHWLSGGLHAS